MTFKLSIKGDVPDAAEMVILAAQRAIDTRTEYLSLLIALQAYIEDAGPCDYPWCADGTEPVCDISNLACVLRRIVLKPTEVDDLIAAEHAWSGIEE